MSTHQTVTDRQLPFTDKINTKICLEQASTHNPFVAQRRFVHGYDMAELMQKTNWVDVFYLMFRGELPSQAQSQLLQQLMIAFMHPGPRHQACRAAMNVGVGKTDAVHLLPIALGVLGGRFNGAGEVEDCMRFIRKSLKKAPEDLLPTLLADVENVEVAGDWHIAPGFGSYFSDIDIFSQDIAKQIVALDGAGACLHWAERFANNLAPYRQGWLPVSVIAATLCDLGFQPRMGACLFQMIMAPGIAAQGVEMSNKPITEMPFVKDDAYQVFARENGHD